MHGAYNNVRVVLQQRCDNANLICTNFPTPSNAPHPGKSRDTDFQQRRSRTVQNDRHRRKRAGGREALDAITTLVRRSVMPAECRAGDRPGER